MTDEPGHEESVSGNSGQFSLQPQHCRQLSKKKYAHDLLWSDESIWVFPKIMVPPNHPF